MYCIFPGFFDFYGSRADIVQEPGIQKTEVNITITTDAEKSLQPANPLMFSINARSQF
ncbi:hypothetical protein [Pelosinus fermentans]|uniref:hypothetical protein n=1 Tax=Pelosinus fermentans TaxID=365349 RepID=UPI00178C3278|nr:hypothetical protein [Pelosinus fermentans]